VNNSESKFQGKNISFEKLDSIQIDYLGSPIVHDLDPLSKTVLFMEDSEFSQEIHVADFEGRILASFRKSGDVPDSYGALMATLRIQDESTFLVNGYNGFMVYDYSGELQSQVKHADFQIPSQQMRAMGYGMEKMGNRYLYINQKQPPQDVKFYKDFKLLTLLDPASGEKEPIIEFPETSMFTNGNYFFPKSWFPVFTVAEDRSYVVFGSEPVIYGYETQPPYSLILTLPFNLPTYNKFTGSDHATDGRLFGMSMVSGRIENIKKIDAFYIIAYFPGYNTLDTKANFENRSPDEARIFRERMQKKYPPRIAILDSLGNLLNDFVPQDLEPRTMLVRNGELWMLENPDQEVEQDYFRLFRVGLKLME